MKSLIIRSGGLGDSLLTMPAALSIKEHHPGSSLHVLGNPMMLSVSGLFSFFDGFHSSDLACFSNLYSDADISEELTCFFSQFDPVYFYTTANVYLIENKLRKAGIKKINIFNPTAPDNLDYHYSLFLKKILYDVISLNSNEVNIPPINLLSVKNINTGKILIHPGSGGTTKNWPLERFIAIAENFKERVLFVIGPAEEEKGIGQSIFKIGFATIAPENLKELCGVISGASVYLGNDSGVSHLAGFLNIPSVILFGPTNPVIWKPVGKNTHIIVSSGNTMDGISTIKVKCKIMELLNKVY